MNRISKKKKWKNDGTDKSVNHLKNHLGSIVIEMSFGWLEELWSVKASESYIAWFRWTSISLYGSDWSELKIYLSTKIRGHRRSHFINALVSWYVLLIHEILSFSVLTAWSSAWWDESLFEVFVIDEICHENSPHDLRFKVLSNVCVYVIRDIFSIAVWLISSYHRNFVDDISQIIRHENILFYMLMSAITTRLWYNIFW